MKVKMLIDQLGSINGIKIIYYKKGQVYTCPEQINVNLVNGWLESGKCEVFVKMLDVPVKMENKIIDKIETKEPIDINTLEYKELQKLAKTLNIKTFGVKKEKLKAEIKKVI